MSSMSFSTGKQFVRPPQRGIFPLDHDSECRSGMEVRVESVNDSIDAMLVFHCCWLTHSFIYAFYVLQKYLECLKDSKDMHHKCRELSRDYLQCRMDNQLMHQENLDNVSRLLTVEVLSVLCLGKYITVLPVVCHLIKYIFYFISWDIPKTKRSREPKKTTGPRKRLDSSRASILTKRVNGGSSKSDDKRHGWKKHPITTTPASKVETNLNHSSLV
jgi:hypothetical protein